MNHVIARRRSSVEAISCFNEEIASHTVLRSVQGSALATTCWELLVGRLYFDPCPSLLFYVL